MAITLVLTSMKPIVKAFPLLMYLCTSYKNILLNVLNILTHVTKLLKYKITN